MGYNIGIDFGATNSTLSYVEEGRLRTFKFPSVEGTEYIPSCLAYDEDGIHVGRAAQDRIGAPDALFCDKLKMVLPLDEARRGAYGWPARKKPETALADFIRQILTADEPESPSFSTQKGGIDGIVLSVPHVWDSLEHPGRLRLQETFKKDLGLPLIQLISEPVAASAYFAYRSHQEGSVPFEGNLLVCDMGGGTFDVTLCQVASGLVTALHNDGNGRRDMGKAGLSFDRRLILDKLRKKNRDIDGESPDFHDFYTKLQAYKANNHPIITQKLIMAAEDPDERERPILQAGLLGFTYVDIEAAFAEVAEGIRTVMGRFKTAMDRSGWAVDAVFFVGGFCQFHLVREEIKKALNLEGTRFIADANREVSRFAISFGAALLANDMYAVEEKFEHTVGIMAWIREEDENGIARKRDTPCPIIIGGKKLGEYEATQFAPDLIRFYDPTPRITIYVAPNGGNELVAEDLPDSLGIRVPQAGLPGLELWRVGMRINASKVVYLVFQHEGGDRWVEYELGDIIRQIFGRPEIVVGGAD